VSKEEIKEIVFMPDGSTPRCIFCGNAMTNWVPAGGRFEGMIQVHSWVCNCQKYPKNSVLSVG